MLAHSRFALGFIAGLLVCSVMAFGWPAQRTPGRYPVRGYGDTINGFPSAYGPRTLGGWGQYLITEYLEGATMDSFCIGHLKGYELQGEVQERKPHDRGGFTLNQWFAFGTAVRAASPHNR